MAGFLTRSERFDRYQSICTAAKEGEEPVRSLIKLYNGMTTEISKYEAEIQRLREANLALVDEMTRLRAAALEVGNQPLLF